MNTMVKVESEEGIDPLPEETAGLPAGGAPSFPCGKQVQECEERNMSYIMSECKSKEIQELQANLQEAQRMIENHEQENDDLRRKIAARQIEMDSWLHSLEEVTKLFEISKTAVLQLEQEKVTFQDTITELRKQIAELEETSKTQISDLIDAHQQEEAGSSVGAFSLVQRLLIG